MSPPAATRRTTRSMAASASIVLTKRRRASVEVNAGLPHSALSVPPSSSFSTPPTKSQRTSAPVKLDDLPTDLGHLIIEHLTIEAMANLTLCSKTTAGWVSSSLLRKVTRCEYDADAGECCNLSFLPPAAVLYECVCMRRRCCTAVFLRFHAAARQRPSPRISRARHVIISHRRCPY